MPKDRNGRPLAAGEKVNLTGTIAIAGGIEDGVIAIEVDAPDESKRRTVHVHSRSCEYLSREEFEQREEIFREIAAESAAATTKPETLTEPAGAGATADAAVAAGSVSGPATESMAEASHTSA